MISSVHTGLFSQFGVHAILVNSTSVSLQFTRWSIVTSLAVTVIVSADSLTATCFFEKAYINVSSPSYSLPNQDLSARSISLIGLEQYYPSLDYNWQCSLSNTYCTSLSTGTMLHVLFFTNMTCPLNSTLTVLTMNAGVCTCNSGFYESGSWCFPNNGTPVPPGSPPAYSNGSAHPSTFLQQLMNGGKNIISIPNLALIVRAREILTFVDDFTYFSYHKKLHSASFRSFS